MIWSFIKTNVDIIVGIIMALSTVSIVYFAYRQHRLERTRLKLEAYDRRRRIYATLKDYMIILDVGAISELRDARRSLREEMQHAKFLFKKGEGIVALKDELLSKGLKIIQIQEKLESSSLSKEEKDRLIREEEQLMQWIRRQGQVIDSKFEKYLQLS